MIIFPYQNYRMSIGGISSSFPNKIIECAQEEYDRLLLRFAFTIVETFILTQFRSSLLDQTRTAAMCHSTKIAISENKYTYIFFFLINQI